MEILFYVAIFLALAFLVLSERIGQKKAFRKFVARMKKLVAMDTVKGLPLFSFPRHR